MKIKAYAVLGLNNKIMEKGSLAEHKYSCSVFLKRNHAEQFQKVAPQSWKLVNCTIEYAIKDTKKSR